MYRPNSLAWLIAAILCPLAAQAATVQVTVLGRDGKPLPDAVVVIVSEETGSISVAIGGMLKRHLMPETLRQLLRNELMPQPEEEPDKPRLSLRELLHAHRKGEQNGNQD